MTSPKAMARDSSASGIQKTSPKAVVQDRDISRISGGEGRGHAGSRGRRPCRGRLPSHGPRPCPCPLPLQTLCGPGNDKQGRCPSSEVQGNGGRCVSSDVRQSGDPGGGPELEGDYEPACGKLLGIPDEIQVLNRATEARMQDPAVMRAQEVPSEQTTVATAASVGEQVQKTVRLFNPRGSPPIMWEGGEDESAEGHTEAVRSTTGACSTP
jgi:hypothetical protein